MQWKWNRKEKKHRIEFEIKTIKDVNSDNSFESDYILESVHKKLLQDFVPKHGYSIDFPGCIKPFIYELNDVLFTFSCDKLGLNSKLESCMYYLPKCKIYGSIEWEVKYDYDMIAIGLSNILNSKLMCN